MENLQINIYYYLKAYASRSECPIKVKEQVVNFNDGLECRLKNRHEICTTFKFSKDMRIL